MENVYHGMALRLILAISRALDKLDAGDAAAAEEILRTAWREVAGEPPSLPLH